MLFHKLRHVAILLQDGRYVPGMRKKGQFKKNSVDTFFSILYITYNCVKVVDIYVCMYPSFDTNLPTSLTVLGVAFVFCLLSKYRNFFKIYS